jgi:hypothetical protein
MHKSAQIDPTGRYRYWLKREWDSTRPCVGFVMLNPSTADAIKDDPTLRACLGFAQRWGYGSLGVVNLFAYRATSPQVLRAVRDPIGAENDHHIAQMCQEVNQIVVAWGNQGKLLGRDQEVLQQLYQHQPVCLGVTKQGCPHHPLYVKRCVGVVAFQ